MHRYFSLFVQNVKAVPTRGSVYTYVTASEMTFCGISPYQKSLNKKTSRSIMPQTRSISHLLSWNIVREVVSLFRFFIFTMLLWFSRNTTLVNMLYIKKIAYYVIKLLIQSHLMFRITSHSITFD